MPPTDPRFRQARSAADERFHSRDVTPPAGGLAPAADLDEAAADAIANAIAAFSSRRRAAAAAVAAAPAPAAKASRIARRLRRAGKPSRALLPIRTAGGWRNG
jgi:hypothetical protein